MGNTLELSVTDKIWELILDAIQEIAEAVSTDAGEMLTAIVEENLKFQKLHQLYNTKAA